MGNQPPSPGRWTLFGSRGSDHRSQSSDMKVTLGGGGNARGCLPEFLTLSPISGWLTSTAVPREPDTHRGRGLWWSLQQGRSLPLSGCSSVTPDCGVGECWKLSLPEMPGTQLPFTFCLSQCRPQAQPASASISQRQPASASISQHQPAHAFPSIPLELACPLSARPLSGVESSLAKFHGSGLGTPGQPVPCGQCVRVFYFTLFWSDSVTLYSPG